MAAALAAGEGRSPRGFVEFGAVGGEGLVVEPAAVEPSVEAAERPRVRPAGVRGERGLREASGARDGPPLRTSTPRLAYTTRRRPGVADRLLLVCSRVVTLPARSSEAPLQPVAHNKPLAALDSDHATR